LARGRRWCIRLLPRCRAPRDVVAEPAVKESAAVWKDRHVRPRRGPLRDRFADHVDISKSHTALSITESVRRRRRFPEVASWHCSCSEVECLVERFDACIAVAKDGCRIGGYVCDQRPQSAAGSVCVLSASRPAEQKEIGDE
jgi:hypothetical protein